MKKVIMLFALCSVLSTMSFSAASAPRSIETISSGEPQPHPQTIFVKTRINGNTVLLRQLVFFTDLVLWVKQDIAYQLEIPIDSFELTFGGAVLDEELPLNAYGITSNSILGLRYL